jgi:hypothetical protein
MLFEDLFHAADNINQPKVVLTYNPNNIKFGT